MTYTACVRIPVPSTSRYVIFYFKHIMKNFKLKMCRKLFVNKKKNLNKIVNIVITVHIIMNINANIDQY